MFNYSRFTDKFWSILALSLVASNIIGCGKSVYSVVSKTETDDAKMQKAVLALNSDKFDEASETLEGLFATDKSLKVSQLYSISLLGQAGYNLFDVIKKALTAITDSSSKDSSAGNAILSKISSVVGTNVTDAQFALMKKAVLVLKESSDQSNSGLTFQKCLTAGIYAAPTIASLTTTIAQLNTTLQALPTKLSASGTTCSASSSVIDEVGDELTAAITKAATLATRIQDVESIMGDCLPSGTADSVNEITAKVTKLATNSDKGCTIPTTQTLGTYSLPSCMNDYILASGGTTAAAGDNKIAGCEVFINCSGSTSCF